MRLKNSHLFLVVFVALLSGFLIAASNDHEGFDIKDISINHSRNSIHRVYDLGLEKGKWYKSIRFADSISSFVFECLNEVQFEGVYVVDKEGTTYELAEINFEGESDQFMSQLVIPNHKITQFDLYTGKMEGTLRLHTLSVPYQEHVKDPESSKQFKKDACQKPNSIKAQIWRKGLPEPVTGRLSTEVHHCIIHHSAVVSTDTNYTNRIRNIYTFHTQVRGWDDIGYNYVVAPDGSLFDGRDPLGVDDQDNIQGAHFCAKNSGTMGICIMGDYSKVPATDSSINALKYLLTWKMFKEGLRTEDKRNHPYPNGDLLLALSGHRDGCATACPGDSVYAYLPTLRKEVQSLVDQCIVASIPEDLILSKTKVWPNPIANYLRVEGLGNEEWEYQLMSSKGELIFEGILAGVEKRIDFRTVFPGNYLLRLTSDQGIVEVHRLIRN